MDRKEREENERLVKLAIEVSEAKDMSVPGVLLKLKDILKTTPVEDLSQLKREIWKFDLLQMIVLALKQDFGATLTGWKTASSLIEILGKCLIGLNPDDKDDFQENFLPSAVERILYVLRKVQQKYIKTSKILADTKSELLLYFNNIIDTLTSVLGAYAFLAVYVMKSPWLHQMMMSDDAETVILMLGLVQSANRMKHDVMKTLEDKDLEVILDELIYKLSSTSSESLAASATRTLVIICDFHPPFVELICNRYKGLRALLNKWEDQGFGRELRRLALLLESGSAQKAELKKYDHAAVKIQAVWKSYYTRKKIKKADVAFAKFQRSFRAKQVTVEQKKEEERLQVQLHHELVLRRRKAMRDLHTRRLQALEILPSSEINQYLKREQHESAVKIQARFRGHCVRKAIHKRRNVRERTAAAITLQRMVRKWLAKLRAQKAEPPNWQRPPGLTDHRRVELMENITKWREMHPVKAASNEERQLLHEKVQSQLRIHSMRSRVIRKKEQQRHNLLARVDMDASLIMDAPRLADVDEKEVDTYICHSVPIATKARQNHNDELRLLWQPWWRKLGDEFQDQQDTWLDWKIK